MRVSQSLLQFKLPTFLELDPVTCSENEFVTILYNYGRNFTAGSEDTCVYGDAYNGKSVCTNT